MAIHAVATLTLFGWVYPLLGGTLIYVWLNHRRHIGESARRGADLMFLGALFFVGRVASPALAWLENLLF
jgi:hypothetical protein